MRRLLAAVLVPACLLGVAQAARADAPGNVAEGRALYAQDCSSCHGRGASGVAPQEPARGAGDIEGAGPSLRGVGARAADLELTTGYMPLRHAYDQPERRRPQYSASQIRSLVAYIASYGGPAVPHLKLAPVSIARGFALFSDHCSGCHQAAAQGGLVVDAVAPTLASSTPTQIAEAIRVGPYVMPRFDRSQLSDRDIASIAAYVVSLRHQRSPGGWALGDVGPVTEGLVAWLIAGAALLFIARLIGGRRAR
jgi:ubiquinol-cytochrome c reductase cytochrome c subunit